MGRFDRILTGQQAIMDGAGEQPGSFKRRFTLAELDAVVDRAGGKCEICGCIPKGKLAMDHCHATGKLRGMLCTECNLGLGKIGDTIEALEHALAYLRR